MSQDKRGRQGQAEGSLIGELVVESGAPQTAGSGLIAEPESGHDGEQAAFGSEVAASLQRAEEELRAVPVTGGSDVAGWAKARDLVQRLQPVPWFIWRLSNFVFARAQSPQTIPEGLVLGLRRLLFAAASDPVLGANRKVNTVREALKVLSPDVVGAVAVIHAVCRKLATQPHERIWRTILDDALLRAQIGFLIARDAPDGIGGGRAMLAGFAGRCGMAIQIAMGELDSARQALEKLAAGEELRSVGSALYKCEPLQVSAMTLTAAGCGRDAAWGTASYGASATHQTPMTTDQRRWYHAFAVIELARTGKIADVPNDFWPSMGTSRGMVEAEIVDAIKRSTRRGHGWSWL